MSFSNTINPKSKICRLHVNKNGKKTGMQPILKLNSTSCLSNNYIFRMNIKKVTTQGGQGGSAGPLADISSGKLK